VLDRQRDRAGAGPDVHDDGVLHGADRAQRLADQDLGLGPRDEDPRAHADRDAPEGLLADEVLERRPRAPLAQAPAVHPRLARIQPVATRVEPGAVDLQHRHQERLGVLPRALDAVPLEVRRRAPDDVGRPHPRLISADALDVLTHRRSPTAVARARMPAAHR
jgi:hypothetical protein